MTSRGAGGRPRVRLPALLALGLCLLVVVHGAVGTVGATHGDEPTSHFQVDLDADGSATVRLVVTFDLANDERRDAFRSLETDDAARTEFRRRFVDRMRSVAAAAEDGTGRDMTVSNPAIELSRTDDGDTGVAVLSVTWTNLAAREDGRLVVTKPFDDGFAPAYDFVITAPEGYRITDASPAPDAREDALATWAAGTSLEGYRVVLEEDPQDETGTSGQPGFGVVGVLLALLAVIAALGRR